MPQACRTALATSAPVHLAILVDLQSAALAPPPVAQCRAEVIAAPVLVAPGPSLDRAAAILNAGRRVCILAGRGALGAREELAAVAQVLAGPVTEASPARDRPTTPQSVALAARHQAEPGTPWETADTLLIVGSRCPYLRLLPRRGRPGGQIDADAGASACACRPRWGCWAT